jgi:predicted nucleotidyltransferase
LEEVTAAVFDVCSRHPVTRMQVFGSLASGSGHAGSDVDLLVDFQPDAPVGLFEMGALKEELEQKLGCHVDLVSRVAVERSKNPYRRRAILRSPITVYAR